MAESALTNTPESPVKPAPVRISQETRGRIGTSLSNALTTARAQRKDLDDALEQYNDFYEMTLPQRNWPWQNASNVFVAMIPSLLDTTVARLAQLVFVPRLYVVKGNTPEAAQSQHEVERYYNTEAWRHNWIEAQYQWVHLTARDGFAALEVLWKRHERKAKVLKEVPVMVEGTTMPMVGTDGKVVMRLEAQEILIREYDDVWLEPVELRDLVKIPAWAPSLDAATFVARRLYLTQADLEALVQSKTLWADAVKEVLGYAYPGDEIVYDEHTGTYSVGGKVEVSQQEVTDEKVQTPPGVYEVWRVQGRSITLGKTNDSGETEAPKRQRDEEMVYWLHDRSQTLMGAAPFEYWHGRRPFVPLAIMPRPNRDIGWGIPERLASTQIEANAIHNQRRDEIDIRLSPPRYKTAGTTLVTQDKPWGPGAEYEVSQKGDVGILDLPDVPPSSWQEEQQLWGNARILLGLDDPLSGKASSSRRTKYEMQLVAASAGIRTDLMAKRVQQAMKQVFWMIHQLKIQYGPDSETIKTSDVTGKPMQLEISKAKLIQDYEMDINGAGSPLDKGARRQEKLFEYSLLMRNPLVANRMDRIFAVTRNLLEEFEEPDIGPMIGTIDEAKQMQEQMQAQAAAGAGQGAPGHPAGGGGPITGGPGAPPHRRRGQTSGDKQAAGLGGGALGG
jgi:hypothetical protein